MKKIFIIVLSVFTSSLFAQTTISIPIVHGDDDAEEAKSEIAGEEEVLGEMDLGSSDLELIFDHTPQYVGLLFRDVQIIQGATITNAYVQFTVDAIKEGVTDAALTLQVYGAKEATVDAITEAPFSISSHPSTEAVVTWNPPPSVAVGDATEAERTPDISSIIAEIVALDGWVPGNNILIVVTGDANQTVDMNREVESFDGDPAGAPTLNVTGPEGQVTVEDEKLTPSNYMLSQNYPNPFNPITTINFSLPEATPVKLAVCNMLGQQVRVLVEKNFNAGSHQVKWDGRDMFGNSVVTGIYLYQIQAGDFSQTKKMLLLR